MASIVPQLPKEAPLVGTARAARLRFFGSVATIFAVSTTLTIAWCVSMSASGSMPMPGDWTMTMAWMRMPGQTWIGGTVSFFGMWVAMMVTMMLPSLAPQLWRCYVTMSEAGAAATGRQTVILAAAYFCVWIGFGLCVYPVGVGLAAAAMSEPGLARAFPAAAGVVVVVCGLFQFTAWKSHCLASCRDTAARNQPWRDGHGAWRRGVRLGLECCGSCAGLMVSLLVMGMMNLAVMAVVTAAITVERLAPGGERAARIIGALAGAAGLALVARATIPG